MPPIEISYRMKEDAEGSKKIETVLPDTDAISALTDDRTGVMYIAVCDKDDTGGNIFTYEREPGSMGIVSLPLDGVPTYHLSPDELDLYKRIPADGSVEIEMTNPAGTEMIVVFEHKAQSNSS